MYNRIKLLCISNLFVIIINIQAQEWNVISDYWAATDALGRKAASWTESGDKRDGKIVAMFYWTWHTDQHAGFEPVMNVREILEEFPEAIEDWDHPAWQNISPGVFFWDEPLFGYYRTTDEWVLRRHAEMLADAGIDVVFCDATNGNFTWKSSYMKLLEVWSKARKDGVKTPQFAFLLPFGPTMGGLEMLCEIYTDLYEPGLYEDLWFYRDGRPLIMAYPETLEMLRQYETNSTDADPPGTLSHYVFPEQANIPEIISKMTPEKIDRIREFFTFRPGQPDYVAGPSRDDHWGWLEVYPQNGYGYDPRSGFEMVPVGIAQNANAFSGGKCNAFSAPGTYGRSFTMTEGWDTSESAYLRGANFMEQWSRAFELDPEMVWITGWNEWIMGRWKSWAACTGKAQVVNSFVDQFDADRSRDIEPVKSWGRYGDVYYIQLVDMVRQFKGMRKPDPVTPQKTIELGLYRQWDDVGPEYRHYRGNTFARNHPGHGKSLIYTNSTGRNDLVLAKVARDDRFVYFYVEADNVITPPTGKAWMRLFLDIDRDRATGWEGYDFMVNRISPANKALLERSLNGWNWMAVDSVDYRISGRFLELKIPRASLGLYSGAELDFEFKWSDNMQEEGNIMDFYINGDTAPGGRFNYVYCTDQSSE